MGLFGGSKSSKKTTYNTRYDTTASSTGFSDVSGSVDNFGITGDHNRISYKTTDHGAIDSALGFAGDTTGKAFDFGGKALDFAGESVDSSLDFAAGANARAGESLDNIISFGAELFGAASQSQGNAMAGLSSAYEKARAGDSQYMLMALGLAAAVVVVMSFKS